MRALLSMKKPNVTRTFLLLIMSATQTSSLSTKSPPTTTTTTLGAPILRSIVQTSSLHDQTSSELDLQGITWLEHINLVIGTDKSVAERFYQEFLGCSRDLQAKFHVNMGRQQFHLAASKDLKDDPPQRVTGSIGVTVPDLNSIRKRIEDARIEFAGTEFDILNDDFESKCLSLKCPWGNVFHLYSKEDDVSDEPISDSPMKMVKGHGEGGTYCPKHMAVKGEPGIRYIEFACEVGTVESIEHFYKEMMGCTTYRPSLGGEDEQHKCVTVSVGPGVHLVFVESSVLTEDDIKAMEGVHICIYTTHFHSLFERLEDRNLLFTNPRFLHLDSCDTWEEAKASRTLRFKDVIDLETGKKVMELEHETRPLRHGQYLKVPFYVPK